MGNSPPAPCCAGPRKETTNLQNFYFVPEIDPVEKELRAEVDSLKKELEDTQKEIDVWKQNIRDNLELREKQAAQRASNTLSAQSTYPADSSFAPVHQSSRKLRTSKKTMEDSGRDTSPSHAGVDLDLDDEQNDEIDQKLNAKQRQLDDLEEALERSEKMLSDKAEFLTTREQKTISQSARLTDANPTVEFLNKDRTWLHRQIIREKQKQEQLVLEVGIEENNLLYLTRQLQILKMLPLPDHISEFQKMFNLPETECPLYEFSCVYDGKVGRLWVCARYVVFGSKTADYAPKTLPIANIISLNKVTERMAAFGKVEVVIISPKNEEETEMIVFGIKKRKIALFCLMKLAEQFNYKIRTYLNSQEFDFLANNNPSQYDS